MRRISTKGSKKPAPGEFIMRPFWHYSPKRCAWNHDSPRNRYKQCVQCIREYRASRDHFSYTDASIKWREDNLWKTNKMRRDHHRVNASRRILNEARRSAKAKNIEFNLTLADIIIPEVCPVLGMSLSVGSGARTNSSISIDRIDPKKGYIKGNIIIVSWRANKLKSDASIDELRTIADFYSNLRQPTDAQTSSAR